MSSANRLQVESFFDAATATFSHLLWDAATRECALVDSVLDFDPHAGRTGTTNADRLAARVHELGLTPAWLLETHVHADHLSAAAYLKARLGGRTAISARITAVQQVFGTLFNAGAEFARDGSQFDRLLEDGDVLPLGGLRIRAWHTPGHTPACMTYVVDDGGEASRETAAFVGDTLFMPDFGTARCDFPGGDPHTLYRSIRRVLSLPDPTRLYLCHDYPPDGRAPVCVTTVAEQKRSNCHVHDGVDEPAFVRLRRERDATLGMPALILPSVQVNMRAGRLPPPEGNGTVYLKIPVDALAAAPAAR